MLILIISIVIIGSLLFSALGGLMFTIACMFSACKGLKAGNEFAKFKKDIKTKTPEEITEFIETHPTLAKSQINQLKKLGGIK